MATASPTPCSAAAPVAAGGDPPSGQARLRDGSWVSIDPVNRADEGPLGLFLGDLCPEARRTRFFSGAVDLGKAAHWAADASAAGRHGLVARDATGVIVGHAVYIELDSRRAEVAVEVADHLHGCGLGTLLIEHLAIVAEEHGIVYFVAEVLSENRAMLDVFREGFDARVVRRSGPEQQVEFLTSGWRLARARFASSAPARG